MHFLRQSPEPDQKLTESWKQVLLLTNFAVGTRLRMGVQVEKEAKRQRERESPVTGRATAMVDSIAWHVIRCQGLMFFASGFDRVAEGGSYEIHYEARNKTGESYSNADCKKFDVFQWCLPWCLSCLLCCSGFLQHLRARQKSCGLLLVSSFASCGCMTLATPCVLLSAVSCIVWRCSEYAYKN